MIFLLTGALGCGMKKNSQGWVMMPQTGKIASLFKHIFYRLTLALLTF